MESRVNKIIFLLLGLLSFCSISGVSASEFNGSLPGEFNNFLTGVVVSPSPSLSPTPTTLIQVTVLGNGNVVVASPNPTPKTKFSSFKGKLSAKVLKVNPQDLDLDDSLSQIDGELAGEVNLGTLAAVVGTMGREYSANDQDEVVEESYTLPGLEDENEFFRANILSSILPSRFWELLAVAALSSLITWGAARQYYLVA
jgi:hypothetical protein